MVRYAVTASKTAAGLLASLAAVVMLALAVAPLVGFRAVPVLSGSMAPKLPVGSVALVQPIASSDVRVGDVITFADPYAPKRLVSHRVVQRTTRDDGVAVYRTKGDANPTRDPWTIRLPNQVDRVRLSVPLAGYALVYSATREVRTALILFGSAFLLVSLLRWIWKPRAERQTVAA